MLTKTEKANQLEQILLDVDAEDHAEKLPELSTEQIDRLHSMMTLMRSQNEMRSRIAFKIKHDISGFAEGRESFAAYCMCAPFV